MPEAKAKAHQRTLNPSAPRPRDGIVAPRPVAEGGSGLLVGEASLPPALHPLFSHHAYARSIIQSGSHRICQGCPRPTARGAWDTVSLWSAPDTLAEKSPSPTIGRLVLNKVERQLHFRPRDIVPVALSGIGVKKARVAFSNCIRLTAGVGHGSLDRVEHGKGRLHVEAGHRKAQQANAALARWPHAACCAFLWRFDMEASFGRVRLDPDCHGLRGR